MRQTGSLFPFVEDGPRAATPTRFLRWSEHVTFGSGGALDRAVGLRKDDARLASLWSSGRARVVPLWRGKPLLAQRAPARLGWVGADHPVLAQGADERVFLGLVSGVAHFAVDISGWVPPPRPGPRPTWFFDPSDQCHPALPPGSSFQDLRGVMAGLSATEAELAAAARALFVWHRESRFCGRCGTANLLTEAGWLRRCPACHARQFPRTEPAVLMPVVHGNSLLLGRAAGWPEGLYSLLAGFVEPGETLESAVRREVFEETGIRVGGVRYLGSQPWPFPGQMMVGCRADALDTDLSLDRQEIEDAVWVRREEMLEILAGRHEGLRAPWKGTLANFLIRNWLADRLD